MAWSTFRQSEDFHRTLLYKAEPPTPCTLRLSIPEHQGDQLPLLLLEAIIHVLTYPKNNCTLYSMWLLDFPHYTSKPERVTIFYGIKLNIIQLLNGNIISCCFLIKLPYKIQSFWSGAAKHLRILKILTKENFLNLPDSLRSCQAGDFTI